MDASKWAVLARFVLVLVSGILAQRGIIEKPTDGEIDTLVASLSAALGGVALAWSLYDKHRTKVVVETALDMPRGATMRDLNARVKLDQVLKP